MMSRRPPLGALLLAACGAAAPSVESQPRCPVVIAPAPASAPVAEGVEPPASLPVPRSTGLFWVRRETGREAARRSAMRAGDTPTSERWGSTSCTSVTIDESSLIIELAFYRPRVRFQRVRDGTALAAPVLTIASRSARIEAACEAPWDPAHAQLFEDRATCNAAPHTFRERCHEEDCEWDDPRARPFTLPGCEDELVSLAARASMLESASYDASRLTQAALERLVAHGGTLFERSGEACEGIAVTHARSGQAILTGVERDENVETTTTERYALEPLFGQATLLDLRSVSRARDGGLRGRVTMSGSPPLSVAVALALGDGVVLLGHRTLYLRERDCEAATASSE